LGVRRFSRRRSASRTSARPPARAPARTSPSSDHPACPRWHRHLRFAAGHRPKSWSAPVSALPVQASKPPTPPPRRIRNHDPALRPDRAGSERGVPFGERLLVGRLPPSAARRAQEPSRVCHLRAAVIARSDRHEDPRPGQVSAARGSWRHARRMREYRSLGHPGEPTPLPDRATPPRRRRRTSVRRPLCHSTPTSTYSVCFGITGTRPCQDAPLWPSTVGRM
jgi:hypothetical protein